MTDDALLEELTRCETAVWHALVSGDMAADATALDERFLGVYPTGFADKAAHVGQLVDGATITEFSLTEMRVMRLGPDHALLAYHARYRRPEKAEEQMYVSSVWVRQGSDWLNVFSQDTPAV